MTQHGSTMTATQQLIQAGWVTDVNLSAIGEDGEHDPSIADYADKYVGSGGHLAAGGASHYVHIDPRYDGWDLVKLDRWGGTGTRRAVAAGTLAELPLLAAKLDRIDPQAAAEVRAALTTQGEGS